MHSFPIMKVLPSSTMSSFTTFHSQYSNDLSLELMETRIGLAANSQHCMLSCAKEKLPRAE